MEPTELISLLNERLEGRLGVEVRTNAENERPVPAVILDDMSTEDYEFHNTPLAQVVETNTGSDKKYYRFYYDVRLDYEVRHNSDPKAVALHDSLRHQFMLLRLNPGSLDGDLQEATLRGGGGLDHAFVEPSETELTQSIVFRTFHQVLFDNYDTIEQIQSDFSLN